MTTDPGLATTPPDQLTLAEAVSSTAAEPASPAAAESNVAPEPPEPDSK
jgi:hypothetical protein